MQDKICSGVDYWRLTQHKIGEMREELGMGSERGFAVAREDGDGRELEAALDSSHWV